MKILVAEDNKLNQKIVQYIFQKKGAFITMTNNGSEAVEELAKSRYDILLIDLHMPVLDGYEAAKIIRNELKSTIPIIALTASISPEDMDSCELCGINKCISKPFDQDKLWDIMIDLIVDNRLNNGI